MTLNKYKASGSCHNTKDTQNASYLLLHLLPCLYNLSKKSRELLGGSSNSQEHRNGVFSTTSKVDMVADVQRRRTGTAYIVGLITTVMIRRVAVSNISAMCSTGLGPATKIIQDW